MNPIACYTTIDAAYPYRLMGQDPQAAPTATAGFNPLLWSPAYKQHAIGGTPPTPAIGRIPGFGLGSFSLHNRSGSTINVGIGVRLPNYLWSAGQWDDTGGTNYTDDTADAQSADSGTPKFALETTTNDDGFVIVSPVPFNAISLRIGTASVGVPVRELAYSNPAGTGWTVITNPISFDGSGAVYAATTTYATESIIVFATPHDWGKTASGMADGSVPLGQYAFRVRATTASSTAGVADSVGVARIFWPFEGLGDNGEYSEDFGAKDVFVGWDSVVGAYGDALVALFTTANVQNIVRAQVRSR